MSNMAYDSLNHARKLKRLGVPEQQAVAHAQILTELIRDDLVTKKDLNSMENSMKEEFQRVRTEFKAECQDIRSEFKTECQDIRSEFKAECQEIRSEFKAECQDIRSEFKAECQDIRTEFKLECKDIRSEIQKSIIKIGGMLTAGLGILFVALKYLP